MMGTDFRRVMAIFAAAGLVAGALILTLDVSSVAAWVAVSCGSAVLITTRPWRR